MESVYSFAIPKHQFTYNCMKCVWILFCRFDRLELAVDSRDGAVAAWAAENEDFQRLVDSVETTPAPEDVKMQKLLQKTSKEIYKLRRTRLPKGQPDFVSFK